MRIHPLKMVAGLLAAGSLASMPAHAAYGSAAASLNNIQYQLLDLNLNDNISPSISFSYKDADGYLKFFASGEGNSYSMNSLETRNYVFPHGSVSAANEASAMHVEAHANAVPGELSVSVYTTQTWYFTLSPSTRLSFSAQADAFVRQEGIDQALAYAGIDAGFDTIIGGVAGREEFSMALYSNDGMRKRLLQGSLDTGAAIGIGTFEAMTSLRLNHYPGTSPIPELRTWAMLAAGLLVLGSVARPKSRPHRRHRTRIGGDIGQHRPR